MAGLLSTAKNGIFRRRAWKPATRMGQVSLHLFYLLVATFSVVMVPAIALAAKKSGNALGGINLSQAEGVAQKPIAMMTAMSVLSLLPFMIIMVTSFVKIAVVLSLIRQALGTNQVPPTQILTGMAIVLTIYIMHPVALQMKRIADDVADEAHVEDFMAIKDADLISKLGSRLKEPIVRFLIKHTHPGDRNLFIREANRMQTLPRMGEKEGPPADSVTPFTETDLAIAIPSFVISELAEAFQIGLIVFLPFLVIDMTVSNILMALGMQMLSPTTVSLPFKLMLFLMVDGWYLLTKGLVLGYQ